MFVQRGFKVRTVTEPVRREVGEKHRRGMYVLICLRCLSDVHW